MDLKYKLGWSFKWFEEVSWARRKSRQEQGQKNYGRKINVFR